jgi:prepilin-type N-terminal cleavage/methylation domain-containing protein
MKPTQIRRTVRAGFTLVELLVVVAIIAVLVGLTAAAVMKLTGLGPQVATRTEIGQLESAIADFNREFKITGAYFPSRLILCKNLQNYYSNFVAGTYKSQLHQDSVEFLARMWPAIMRPDRASCTWATQGIDWSGGFPKFDTAILEGDQCLVFFLGGIPQQGNTPGVLGFSTNQQDPSQASATRKGPFFEFKTNKLLALSNNGFYSYADEYKTGAPYAYFSSYKSRNGYNRYYSLLKVSDCDHLKTVLNSSKQPIGEVWPYAETLSPSARYLKPNSFQIISAGADGMFGIGTNGNAPIPFVWNSATAASIDVNGRDDQANFSSSFLNVPE